MLGSERHGVWGSVPDDVWVAGVSAAVLHWSGAAWASTDGQAANVIGGSGAGDRWVVGDGGAIQPRRK